MPRRKRRASIRFWQTGLFIAVIVVATLILSGSLSAGLQSTLSEMGRASEIRNASALARRLAPDMPLTRESRERIERTLVEYRSIYGAGIWVYDRGGGLVASSYDTGPAESGLDTARRAALPDAAPHATIDLRPGGWAVASRAIVNAGGEFEGVVVTASPVDDSLRVLDAVRDRLWITFWISLVVAGLLGFAFSEIISRRVRAMLDAADGIADGDFEQRLPTGLVPDEIQDLALAYNRMAIRLGEAFGAIRESEAAQRRFVADASHELRTPIAALKGMLELLADGAADDAEVREDFIATMQVETDRLGRLVSDLLTLAQLDAGSLRLTREPEWAADLLGDVARVMHGLAEQADVTLTVDPPVDDVQVRADRDRVVQVLLSFTDNAIKHSGPGTTVRLRGRRTGDSVLLEVADEGPGIGEGELERVFERFYRAEDARPAGRGGAGLGLAIAKEIVEAHGSRIEVRSRPGEGTTFGFELPVA